MIITKAQKKDFNEINDLIENEFPYTKSGMKKIPERIREGNTLFVSKNKKDLFGFIEFKLTKPNAELFALAVKKKFRRKGIGKKLFYFFVDLCKKNKIEKVSLILKKNNLQAKNLYKSNGFVKTGELKRKIENSVVEKMELNLNSFKGLS